MPKRRTADTRAETCRRRRRTLALLALLGSVGLTGCAAAPQTFPPAPDPEEGARVLSQEPVNAPGVESCRAIARLQRPHPIGGDSGLDPIRLQCLTDGPSVDLSRLGGKPVLVNVWASWCTPCRKEMPLLQAANERYGDQVQVVGVDIRDDPHAAAEFLHEVGVTYPQLTDPNADLPKQLRIPGVPITLILDRDGAVLDKHIGPFEEASLSDLLERTLAEASP